MLKRYFKRGRIEAGCDEAGRGCLAGPVFAAAVILPKRFSNKVLTDSKQLTEEQRNELRVIIENEAIAWAVGKLSPREIDRHNILKSSFYAMHRAIDQLNIKPEALIIDGNRFIPYQNLPFDCIIKGDAKYLSIAAASILAKTHRDEYMQKIARRFPHYHWQSNKGYPTKAHRQGIAEHGPCKHHRKTFRLLPDPEQLELDLKA